jgi:hypothetical protein
MPLLRINKPWDQVKEQLKEQHTDLTDEDLAPGPENEKQLLEKISTRLNKSREETADWINSVAFTEGKAG